MPSKIILVKNLQPNKNKTESPNIDLISKMFIIFLSFMGWNRCGVFKINNIISKLIFIYCIILNVTLCYVIFWPTNIYLDCVKFVNIIGFTSCSLLSYMFTNNIYAFFEDINIFNLNINYNTKIGKSSIHNASFCVTYIMFVCITYIILILLDSSNLVLCLAFIHIVFNVELFYYGHLLSILLLRVQLLRKMLSTYFLDGNSKYEKRELNDIIILYHVIIKAFDNLNAAIKYQFLCLIIVTFFTTVIFLDLTMIQVYNGEIELWGMAIQAMNSFVKIILPFFSPCFYAHRICNEVSDVRNILTANLRKLGIYISIIYDKNNRRPAKILLRLTKIRTLSFSIFRMFQVDLLLPFNLLVLIANYLIILLQFQKVTGSGSS
nr:gustatory receptor 20 [Papilio xuthus]